MKSLFLLILFPIGFAHAECYEPPSYCAEVEIVKYEKNNPKYSDSRCVIQVRLKKFKKLFHTHDREKLKVGELVDFTTVPESCLDYKKQIGKTLIRGFTFTRCETSGPDKKYPAPEYLLYENQDRCPKVINDPNFSSKSYY